MSDQVLVARPDTPAPGFTRFGPDNPSSKIGDNPLGQWTPPPYVNAGEYTFQQISVTTNPVRLAFNAHEHIQFQNQGLGTIQVSKDGAVWIDMLPSGLTLVHDFHRENFLWVQSPVGTNVLIVTTW